MTATDLTNAGLIVRWYNVGSDTVIGTGLTYTVTNQQAVNVIARLETA